MPDLLDPPKTARALDGSPGAGTTERASLLLAGRVTTPADQERFTAVSGDRNPLHLAVFAGWPGYPDRPVVHGIHTLLWALDSFFAADLAPGPIASLRVRFEKVVHVGDRVRALLERTEAGRFRLNLVRDEERVASIYLTFGAPGTACPPIKRKLMILPDQPQRMTFDDLAGFEARIPILPGLLTAAELFPYAARLLGTTRIAGLVCTSAVVGMICPGLHSLYAGLSLTAVDDAENDDSLDVVVDECDERFLRVKLAIAGAGWAGLLDTLFRLR
jgi:acyl dehydratase